MDLGEKQMITKLREGNYRLIETKENNIKILYLDTQAFAWVRTSKIGQMLVVTHVPHTTDVDLAMGRYVMYDVDDEPYLTDTTHLELEYGRKAWQGYLLITGLPNDQKIRARIIPTTQIITSNPRFSMTMGFNRWGFALPEKLKIHKEIIKK